MYSLRIVVFVVVTVIFLCMTSETHGSPFRMKRVSDHRLAELETLLALSKMKGQVMTVPLGYGKVDPERIGRRRRSVGGKRRDVSERKRSYTSVETNSHK